MHGPPQVSRRRPPTSAAVPTPQGKITPLEPNPRNEKRRRPGGGGRRRHSDCDPSGRSRKNRIRLGRTTGQGGGGPIVLCNARPGRRRGVRILIERQGQGGGGPCRSDLRAPGRRRARISVTVERRGREEESPAALITHAQGGGGASVSRCLARRRHQGGEDAVALDAARLGRRRGEPQGHDQFREEEELVGIRKTYFDRAASSAMLLMAERLMPRSARSRSVRADNSLSVVR